MANRNTKTPAMVLQELTVKRGLAPPTYEITHAQTGTHNNRFDYMVRVAGIVAEGTGTSKQIAKHDAAQSALTQLEEIGIYNPSEIPVQEFNIPTSFATPASPFKASPNCIGPLKDLCVDQKIQDPVFTLVSDLGPPHCREFTYECTVASLKTIATANTKKMAKQLAAQEMMEKIKDVLPEIVVTHPRKEDSTTLALQATEHDEKVVRKYDELFGNVVIDKTVKVSDFASTFGKLMKEYEKSINDFTEDLLEKTEDALTRILDQIGLKFKCSLFQEDPIVVTVVLNSDTPFTTMGMGKTEEEARQQALGNAFEILDLYLRL
ncbi:hypothetical protein JTB14_029744 [Gonioctena quinquepunctata]|nr:hypothetical protein JTB14_029744 [Gonioctena quinquepunctata]